MKIEAKIYRTSKKSAILFYVQKSDITYVRCLYTNGMTVYVLFHIVIVLYEASCTCEYEWALNVPGTIILIKFIINVMY